MALVMFCCRLLPVLTGPILISLDSSCDGGVSEMAALCRVSMAQFTRLGSRLGIVSLLDWYLAVVPYRASCPALCFPVRAGNPVTGAASELLSYTDYRVVQG